MKASQTTNPFSPSNIVVGVDGEGLSDHAVRLGLELGSRLSARVDLIHVVPAPPETWPGLDPVRSAALTAELLIGARSRINEHLRSVLREPTPAQPAPDDASGGQEAAAQATALLAAPPDVDPVRVIPGRPTQVLLDEVRRGKAGLIVLGGHRKRGFLDFGSTLRAIFAKASVPVWVQAQPFDRIEQILVPVDLSAESLKALAISCALARMFLARVRAVHCVHVGAFAASGGLDIADFGPSLPLDEVRRSERAGFGRAMQAFEWDGIEHTTECVDGDPGETILDLSGTADLTVMGAHGRTGLASVVLGGTAYSVLKRAEKPVLVTRDPARKFLV
jgi:nucleotide-binding universal stress UspA family protein